MGYNISGNVAIKTNTDIGNVSLNTNQIRYLVSSEFDFDTFSGGHLVFDCDIGVRLYIEKINYIVESDTPNLDGIKLYYKNEDFEDYAEFDVSLSNNTEYITTFSGTSIAPRYIRVDHDFDLLPGTIKGFEIITNSEFVRFGDQGDKLDESFEVARGGSYEIRQIPILNNTGRKVDAMVFVEPNFDDIDNCVYISKNHNGPWYNILDYDNVIADVDNFDLGVTGGNMSVLNSTLTLSFETDLAGNMYASSIAANGTYRSRIFYNDYALSRILLKKIKDGFGIAVDEFDTTDTIEIRSSNHRPKSYSVLRVLYRTISSNTRTYGYRDYWRHDLTIKESSLDPTILSVAYRDIHNYYFTMDPVTENWAGIIYYGGTSTYSSHFRLFNCINGTVRALDLATRSSNHINFQVRFIKMDSYGGVWAYFYCTTHGSSHFVNETGYYLVYFDSNLENMFKLHENRNFIDHNAIDISYENRFLWYIDSSSGELRKLSHTGELLERNYNNIENTGGLTSDLEDGCWYANGNDLYHLSKYALLIDSVTDVTSDKFTFLAIDPADKRFLWGLDSSYLKRVCVSGENKGLIDMSIFILSPLRLFPVNEGCWVMCGALGEGEEDGSNVFMRFVSKENKRVERSLSIGSFSLPGVMEFSYESSNYVSKLPISIDNVWNNLSFKKVILNKYYTPEEKYHQLRITLRRKSVAEVYNLPDQEATYLSSDYFQQPDGRPQNIQLWGAWLHDSRVYVANNELVLVGDNTSVSNAYIDTRNRVVVFHRGNNIDVRIKFRRASTASALRVYLRLYSVDNTSTMWFGCETTINSNGSGEIRVNTSSSVSSSSSMSTGTMSSYLSFTLRFLAVIPSRIDGQTNVNNIVYAYLYNDDGNLINDVSRSSVAGQYGLHKFFVQMISDRLYASAYVDNFRIISGNVSYSSNENVRIEGVYTQKNLMINDIYPKTNKPVYVKVHVKENDVVKKGNYDVNLLTTWRTPVDEP